MADKCKYCGRVRAASAQEFEDDIDGRAGLCGRGTGHSEAYYDCLSHEAHVSKLRLMRAETLLSAARMLHLMDRPYVDRVTSEITAFLDKKAIG